MPITPSSAGTIKKSLQTLPNVREGHNCPGSRGRCWRSRAHEGSDATRRHCCPWKLTRHEHHRWKKFPTGPVSLWPWIMFLCLRVCLAHPCSSVQKSWEIKYAIFGFHFQLNRCLCRSPGHAYRFPPYFEVMILCFPSLLITLPEPFPWTSYYLPLLLSP